MARGNLVVDADALGRSAIRLYFRGGGVGVCETGLFERCLDMRPAWPAVLQDMFHAEQQLFDTDGASGYGGDVGIPWEPNTGSYFTWKSREHNETRPLRLTNMLMLQLTGQGGSWDAPYVRQGMTTFEFGADTPVEDWSGLQVWWGDGDVTPREDWRHISMDEEKNEDVAGMHSVSQTLFRGIGAYLRDDPDRDKAMSRAPRRAVSLGPDAEASVVESIMDHITMAPVVGGWYNPGTRSWMPGLRRAGGGPLVANAGRVYRTGRTGRRRRVGEITPE